MITFKQFIVELADRKAKFDITRADEKVFDARATIGDRRIDFSAVQMGGKFGFWNVVFSEEWYDEEEKEWRGSIDVTGSGKEFEVLSLIVSCMKEFLKRNDPDEIRFSAAKGGKSNTRAAIYRKLADRLLKGFEREENDDGPEVEFRYTKRE